MPTGAKKTSKGASSAVCNVEKVRILPQSIDSKHISGSNKRPGEKSGLTSGGPHNRPRVKEIINVVDYNSRTSPGDGFEIRPLSSKLNTSLPGDGFEIRPLCSRLNTSLPGDGFEIRPLSSRLNTSLPGDGFEIRPLSSRLLVGAIGFEPTTPTVSR